MSLNTRIRGLQIKDADITVTQLANDAVETAIIKDLNVTLAKHANMGLEAHILVADAALRPVSVAVSGDITIDATGAVAIGATKVTDAMMNDDVATGLAGVGLSNAAGVLAVDLDEVAEVAITVANDYVVFMDADDNGDTKKEQWADIATAIAGTGITAVAGVLNADALVDNVLESDIQKEDESANCTGSQTDFTLSNTPLANSIQVYLNGLLQQEGSAADYTVSGTTISFITAPASDDLLIIHYIIDNA